MDLLLDALELGVDHLETVLRLGEVFQALDLNLQSPLERAGERAVRFGLGQPLAHPVDLRLNILAVHVGEVPEDGLARNEQTKK